MGFGLTGFAPSAAQILLNRVPGASALYMPDRKLSSRIINGVRTLRTSNNDELDFSPAQIGRGELVDFVNEPIDLIKGSLRNGDMEAEGATSADLATWGSLGTGGVRDTSESFSGNASARIDVNANGDLAGIRQAAFGIQVGCAYKIEFYAKAAGNFRLRIDIGTGNGDIENIGLTSDWVKYEYTFTVVGTGGVFGFARTFETSASTTCWIDDVVVTQLTADGRTPILYDWSGNGNHATQTTVAAQPFIATAGVLEEGLRFAGGQWLDTGSETIGDGLFAGADRRWTVSFWCKATTSGTYIGRAGGEISLRTFHVGQTSVGTRPLFVNLSGTAQDLTPAINPDGIWRNISITWNGTTAKVYVNGDFYQNLLVGTAAEETGQRIIIGARTNGAAFQLGAGNIAFTGIWDRAITEAEIETVYNLTDPR
jgi:hypothetical protein